MTIPNRSRWPSEIPGYDWLVTDDGSRTLCNLATEETFHSGCGALTESLVVYLENSEIGPKLRCGSPCRVLEIGFGTGTTFFLAAALAELNQTSLLYHGIESNPLPASTFIDLQLAECVSNPTGIGLPNWIRAESEAVALIVSKLVGQFSQRFRWNETKPNPQMRLSSRVDLFLHLQDARVAVEMLARQIAVQESEQFDAVFFDPFCPDHCPELWTAEVLTNCYSALCAGGRFVSYCVKSSVRRRLAAIGFDVQKRLGPKGGKREVLVARKPQGV